MVSILSGCAGYQFGAASMFHPNVRTVHVPVFESETLRRHLGERLTEAVIKELELRGLKAVGPATADSMLHGRIVNMNKQVLGEDRNDVPRNLEAELLVTVTWTDRQGRPLMQNTFRQPANFIPEAGQSMATAQQQAMSRMARQIVGRMELSWH